MSVACPECKSSNPEDAKACVVCGASFTLAKQTGPPEAPTTEQADMEDLLQELGKEYGGGQSGTAAVEALLHDLQHEFAYIRRGDAAEQLGNLSVSSPRIVQALVAAQESDPKPSVRTAAAAALRTPAHQRLLQQHPELRASGRAVRSRRWERPLPRVTLPVPPRIPSLEVVVGAATAVVLGILVQVAAGFSGMTATAQDSKSGGVLAGLCGLALLLALGVAGALLGRVLGAVGKRIWRRREGEWGATAGGAAGGFLGGALAAAVMIALFLDPGSWLAKEVSSQVLVADLRSQYDEGRRTFAGIDLGGADLSGVSLPWADLPGADLSGADLSGANLGWSDLPGADLTGADLRGANLLQANLRGADLGGADLTGAILTGADLTEAIATKEQLAQAESLEGATLPDGTVHE